MLNLLGVSYDEIDWKKVLSVEGHQAILVWQRKKAQKENGTHQSGGKHRRRGGGKT
jgi:hypothetical protein